jgi:tetratricopeptide (TPR) repeat protein
LLPLLLVLLLSVMTLVAYWDVAGNGFVNYDDPAYVLDNRHVKEGLTLEGVAWAFTTSSLSNWHPLTWLSLMLDHDLYGMNPGGYHWTSLFLHLLAGLALFFALDRMTGQPWGSFFVAALFLVHPLHVESVAWVAERKDVLSGLFWMLGLLAYSRYVACRTFRRYLAVALFFVLGLLSKPMAVTFPFVLLLLDFWPLRRMEVGVWKSIGPLVVEKIPLFALSVAASAVTFWVQREGEAVASLQNLPLADRLANALVAYGQYLVKTVWPFALCAFYPHPGSWPLREALLAAGLLLLITALVILTGRRKPCLLTGWLWYLGTLVPVIGIVQVGAQAMADRYTYLPLIGIFIMVAWAVGEAVRQSPTRRALVGAVGGGVLLLLVALTQAQVGTWRDSISLFTNALKATDGNYQAYTHLGRALTEAGRYGEAIENYRRSLRISPNYMPAYNNMGLALMELGRLDEAMAAFDRALAIKPEDGNVLFNRGEVFVRKGMLAEAVGQYRLAIRKNPYNAHFHNNLGVALTRLGKAEEAIPEYRLVIGLDPGHAGARNNLAMLLAAKGETDEAIRQFREALRLQPRFVNAHYQLSKLLAQKGAAKEAAFHLAEAVRLNPDILKLDGAAPPGAGGKPEKGRAP